MLEFCHQRRSCFISPQPHNPHRQNKEDETNLHVVKWGSKTLLEPKVYFLFLSQFCPDFSAKLYHALHWFVFGLTKSWGYLVHSSSHFFSSFRQEFIRCRVRRRLKKRRDCHCTKCPSLPTGLVGRNWLYTCVLLLVLLLSLMNQCRFCCNKETIVSYTSECSKRKDTNPRVIPINNTHDEPNYTVSFNFSGEYLLTIVQRYISMLYDRPVTSLLG